MIKCFGHCCFIKTLKNYSVDSEYNKQLGFGPKMEGTFGNKPLCVCVYSLYLVKTVDVFKHTLDISLDLMAAILLPHIVYKTVTLSRGLWVTVVCLACFSCGMNV